jgi:hypothetical protein
VSATNRWGLDVAEARARGRAAAGKPDPCTRMSAFGDLCQGLGEAASVYACPLTAARALVSEAARAYQGERRTRGRA